MQTTVAISLLGRFEMRVDAVRHTERCFPRRDAAALVKLLGLTPGHRLHREQVFDALWPDLDVDTAAARLHKAAHYVRKVTCSREALVLRGDAVALFPDAAVVTDVAEFEAEARRALTSGDPGAIATALSRYSGALLPGDLYEEWAHETRGRLELLRERLESATSAPIELRAPDAGVLVRLETEVRELRALVETLVAANGRHLALAG